jgi:hypothetical protein
MDDVAQTLDKFAVPAAERAEVVAIIESTRTDIVVSRRACLESGFGTGRKGQVRLTKDQQSVDNTARGDGNAEGRQR